MHSARTDRVARPLRSASSIFGRLNVRFVVALAAVALVALLVSGIALTQVLPGYFLDQAQRRLETASIAVAVLAQNQLEREAERNLNSVLVGELRNTRVFMPVAQAAANTLAQGTVEIYYQDGTLAARAEPDADTVRQLREAGLAPDPEAGIAEHPQTLSVASGVSFSMHFRVSSIYTNRVATLQRVTGTLIGAGLAALFVSMLLGLLAARRLTGPLARLRRASSRFAMGDMDERAPSFEILEVDELGQQFNLMADQVSESVRQLQADRDRLREFLADVSHELRTPIAALRTFTELQRDGQPDEEQRREFLDRSTEQINRLEWMSTNLLDLSRIDAGIFPLDMRSGDLRDPVRSTVEAQAEMAEQRGISLASQVPTSPVMLRFDRERVVQLLSNLVGNALKFTPRGGEVIVALRDGAEAVTLQVRDSGPGIPAAELPHVFDRFFRGTNVGEARASGSGLGLAIARSIVEMHGGRISVASEPGSGSTFTIVLPRTPEGS